jgi:ATP-dependent Clp protease adapter protein ClpS
MIGPMEATELPFWLVGADLEDVPQMAMPDILDRPLDDTREKEGAAWIVTVYDNDYNTYEEVMMILMAATGCSAQEAYIEAWEIDHLGKCVVHNSSKDDCQMAASIIAEIGIQVEVSKA